ncbi:MAG TPA: NAD-dependent epimerase/dehydratase family protein [Mycobacteriales bacterium]|nr:NAD-dependent epimerase/dehydratase family protein [Mycobacteriales bacterium]
MTSAAPPVRARRAKRSVVAVTGAASGLGRLIAERLSDDAGLGRVIAIDATRGDLTAVTWRLCDVRDPSLAARLGGVDVVVHGAVETSPDAGETERHELNVTGTNTVVTAAAAAGVRRVVLVTSAMVYGALEDNPVPLGDDAPVRAPDERSLVGDWVQMEQLADRARRVHPGLSVTVLRPATLTGPGADSALTRHFEAPRLLVVRGREPFWQFCHVDDLVSAVGFAARGALDGAVNVAADGWLTQHDVERITGLRRLVLPAGVVFGTAERLHRIGVTPAPASELAYLTQPWVVSCERLRAAGWQPGYDNEAALRAQVAFTGDRIALMSRRVDRRDATRAAAGATVAVVGAVAIARARAVRRRRRTS